MKGTVLELVLDTAKNTYRTLSLQTNWGTGKCKSWTLDSWTGLWTGLWTEIWTGFWTDAQFNDDHFQHNITMNGLDSNCYHGYVA